MTTTSPRVRFAPSPTGFMHLGNVRSALINYLFARQKGGVFVIRIEDTDPERNVDPSATRILSDLAWLKITFDEGPEHGGKYEPYFQSERTSLYSAALDTLKLKRAIYRCFCTSEELEKKRQRQLALKQPPRYDRACLALSPEEVEAKSTQNIPFIWRFILDHSTSVEFYDLAHKTMHFDLKHFSDIPLTRQDGSFTFLFANFVDDVAMKITHVFRGEDHLTNTAVQIALYKTFEEEIPVYCHLPILCNVEGKKLSKRDFGFSLTDLKQAGFLPEAITNYLAIIGVSVPKEILSSQEMIENYNFDHLSSTGHIKYDVEKLRWVNHQWIKKYNLEALVDLCKPFIYETLPQLSSLEDSALKALIAPLQEELITLKQSAELLAFVVTRPSLSLDELERYNFSACKDTLRKCIPTLATESPQHAAGALKAICVESSCSVKDIYSLIRLALTGSVKGPAIQDLLGMLSPQEVAARLENLIKF